MPLLKVFTPSEIKQMNEELKIAIEENKVLVSIYGYDSVLSYYADKIYKSHGGN